MKPPLHADLDPPRIGDARPAPRRSGTLRIEVSATPHVPAQARAYAEYRLFGALAVLADVAIARVSLRPGRGRADVVVCRIVVVHHDGRRQCLRATGAHTYQAINAAVDRLVDHYASDLPAGRDDEIGSRSSP